MPLRLFASMGLTLCAICFHSFIFVVYLSKRKYREFESIIFLFMYILTFIILLDECLYIYAMYKEIEEQIVFIPVETFCYTYIYLNIIWFIGLMTYIISKMRTNQSSENDKKERIIIVAFLGIISAVLFIIASLLKIEYPASNSDLYVFSGTVIYILYGIAIVALFIICMGIVIRRKNITNYQKYPIFFCLIIMIMVNGLQYIFDYDLNSLSFLLSLIMITLYFTIESQDYKSIHELERKSEEAEIAYKTKTQFLVNISHEIRTPLNTILNISNALINEDNIADEQIQNEGKMINDAGEELHETINNILDISNAESRKLENEEINYNMNDLIYNVDQEINNRIKDHKVSLKIESSSNLTQTYKGDSKKISKMLIYIIDFFINNTEYGIVSLQIKEKKLSDTLQEISFEIVSPATKIHENNFYVLFDNFKNYELKLKHDVNNISLELIVAREYLDILGGKYQVVEKENELHCNIQIKQTVLKQ